ncbi:hypothetical protein PAXINDRAFT_166255 [Paxillus involutus ATCC 200175]|nr:hypothetical protein PAXINDRAFT_166255 [Paxillus involutus ATCC 200175]
MSISSPKQLVDEFKKSGEFDRLRRELLTQFQRNERIVGFKSRVDDIARQRLASDAKLIDMPHDAIYRELVGEIDRYPIVERAVAEAPLLSDTSFAAAIHTSVRRILDESKVAKTNPETGGTSASLSDKTGDGLLQESSRPSVNHGPLENGNVQHGSTH